MSSDPLVAAILSLDSVLQLALASPLNPRQPQPRSTDAIDTEAALDQIEAELSKAKAALMNLPPDPSAHMAIESLPHLIQQRDALKQQALDKSRILKQALEEVYELQDSIRTLVAPPSPPSSS
ncbi:uncharacterized protein BJ171DRAFT_494857 [Polychytrium aggregatum]|uniref:uncharacterized protein n=1 Tax=Polychytrium aggregatum TaxID=110093 RepID=UPI0022FE73DA|nr:uncharacterized protein BJ171DRAFT_494857 [Polychytrium aggregatum]KAI9206810.1 hypothetical protein BJ171DRAFT_494857 [Polychytrium aggregatum]